MRECVLHIFSFANVVVHSVVASLVMFNLSVEIFSGFSNEPLLLFLPHAHTQYHTDCDERTWNARTPHSIQRLLKDVGWRRFWLKYLRTDAPQSIPSTTDAKGDWFLTVWTCEYLYHRISDIVVVTSAYVARGYYSTMPYGYEWMNLYDLYTNYYMCVLALWRSLLLGCCSFFSCIFTPYRLDGTECNTNSRMNKPIYDFWPSHHLCAVFMAQKGEITDHKSRNKKHFDEWWICLYSRAMLRVRVPCQQRASCTKIKQIEIDPP